MTGRAPEGAVVILPAVSERLDSWNVAAAVLRHRDELEVLRRRVAELELRLERLECHDARRFVEEGERQARLARWPLVRGLAQGLGLV
jgi:hypothetical protein